MAKVEYELLGLSEQADRRKSTISCATCIWVDDCPKPKTYFEEQFLYYDYFFMLMKELSNYVGLFIETFTLLSCYNKAYSYIQTHS